MPEDLHRKDKSIKVNKVNNTKFYMPAGPAQAEVKVKNSRFLGFSFPVESESDVKKSVSALREEHFKARHCCLAWRLGTDGNCFRANDDGEPSGSAGRPILGRIDSLQLTNTLVVVVRYFGGTLLGVPGLISAYKGAAAAVLDKTVIIEKEITVTACCRCSYADFSRMLDVVKKMNLAVVKQETDVQCSIILDIPVSKKTEAVMRLSECGTVTMVRA